MRWYWIDRFIEFQSGRRAVAMKGTSMSEAYQDDYCPGFPTVPVSLMIEGLAQTGGLLVGEWNHFRERVVLAKISKAVFQDPILAGEQLTYTAELADMQPDGAICHATIHAGGRLRAEVELMFAHLEDRFAGVDLFDPADFLRMLRVFEIFKVGVDRNGAPIQIPEHLLLAEQADLERSVSP